VKDATRTQTFTYDLLNRLSTAQEGSRWSNNYTYDAWGNLTKKLYGSVQAGEHMDTSADTGNHLMGYSYDTGGNMTTDGVNTYAYDGENRITSVAGVSYTYDADGRRVKKSSGTNYWYGPSGEPLAETDSAGTWTNYVFFAGQRLARNVNGDIKYYITDHLHSTGMFVDKAGTAAAVLDDNDFYPWGGVVAGVGKTTSNNTVKFTGKYHDSESGLDYFGARYYANAIGRFMSPDWADTATTVPYAEFGDPQSLNLYGYVENVPVNRVDADGHSYAGMDGFMRQSDSGIPMADVEISVADGGFQLGDNGTRGPDEEPQKPQPTQTAENYKPWESRDKAVQLLRSHNACSDWLNQGNTAAGSAADLMSWDNILLSPPPKGPLNQADAHTDDAPKSVIYVNPKGRFYKDSNNQLPLGGKYTPGSFEARMVIFFHELGHQMHAPGIVPDGGPLGITADTRASDKNTQAVIEHCGTAIYVWSH
jgi:RHS repeat-associated protein